MLTLTKIYHKRQLRALANSFLTYSRLKNALTTGPDMTTWITICDTCKRDGWDTSDKTTTDGEVLASLVEAAAISTTDVRTRRVSCLMGCKQGCNVAIQSHGKLAYTIGNFEPIKEVATGIVEYATKHAASERGQVPFREWPKVIKGHFVTRHPPIPNEDV